MAAGKDDLLFTLCHYDIFFCLSMQFSKVFEEPVLRKILHPGQGTVNGIVPEDDAAA